MFRCCICKLLSNPREKAVTVVLETRAVKHLDNGKPGTQIAREGLAHEACVPAWAPTPVQPCAGVDLKPKSDRSAKLIVISDDVIDGLNRLIAALRDAGNPVYAVGDVIAAGSPISSIIKCVHDPGDHFTEEGI